jgi:hypothetical protein
MKFILSLASFSALSISACGAGEDLATDQAAITDAYLKLDGVKGESAADRSVRFPATAVHAGAAGPRELITVTASPDLTEPVFVSIRIDPSVDFFIDRDDCSDNLLPPGLRCEVLVQFRPTEPGERLAEIGALGRIPSTGSEIYVTKALSGSAFFTGPIDISK